MKLSGLGFRLLLKVALILMLVLLAAYHGIFL